LPKRWTVTKRQEVVARAMGSLSHTHTSGEAFSQRKHDEKAHGERQWNA
jgi:hypothetical protein